MAHTGERGRGRLARQMAGAVLAAVLACAGCATGAGAGGNAAGADTRGDAAAAQAAAFPEAYAQEVTWRDCTADDGLDSGTAAALNDAGVAPTTMRCGTVIAPFDWEDPENPDQIELAIVHIPATGTQPLGTLFGNPGGPGERGVDFTIGMPLSPGFGAVMERYDLLGFDPRGVGDSTPLECDGAGSELPVVQMAECIAGNPIAHTMGTSQVARDMELLRSLMEAERLDYLGYSYGTMLGASYATLFPERVGRMVLDSAENAQWANLIHTFDQQLAIARATVALATSCRTEYRDEVEVCPFVDEDSLLTVLDQLDDDPLVAGDGTQIDGAALSSILTSALYASHFERGRVLDQIALALLGDQDAVDDLASPLTDAEGTVDLAMTIISCHSFPIEPDVPGLLEHIRSTGVPRLLGGPEITDDVLAPFVDITCYTLPESGLDITDTFSFDAPGAEPILVIGITGDHATPYPYAQELVQELGNARLLTLDGQGHAASYSDRSHCVDTAVTQYLLDGTLPSEGSVCTDD